jgi:hypothetical protein
MRTAQRLALTALTSLFAATACAGSPATTGAAPGTAGGGGASHALQGGGSRLPGTPGRQQSGLYTGGFSIGFASCMRAHGVLAFPDPDGTADQLSHTGIDTHSAAFQDALYGPCRTQAPAAWVASQPLGPPPTAP